VIRPLLIPILITEGPGNGGAASRQQQRSLAATTKANRKDAKDAEKSILNAH
jgi:hypothetical protein